MSFLKINDPSKRDSVIEEFLRLRKSIQLNNVGKRLDESEASNDLKKFFKPVVDTQAKMTKSIVNELVPIKEGIAEIPRAIPVHSVPSVTDTRNIHDALSQSEAGDPEHDKEQHATFIGLIAERFLKKIYEAPGGTDQLYGLRTDPQTGQFYIGNKPIDISGDDIIIGDKEFTGTPGLWELLVSNDPNKDKYTIDDHEQYREIMILTNALRRNYDELNPHPKASRGKKWKTVLKNIWSGKGLETIVIPSDPNALIERLELLKASSNAGNTGVRNEMVSICDELLRQNILNKKQYKSFLCTI